MKISKKTGAALVLAAVIVLAALWFALRSGLGKSEPVSFEKLPGLSGTPVFTVAELVRLRADSDPLVIASVTSERDVQLAAKIAEILSGYGFIADDPDSVSADAVRIRFAFGEDSASALEIRSDSGVTLYGSGKSASYRAVNREGVAESAYCALSRLFVQDAEN